MRLWPARLPKGPPAIQEYGVLVAEIVGTNAPLGHLLDDLPKPSKAVARLRTSLRWDRKTNRLPFDDRRGNLSSGAIEALSTKDNSHGRSKPLAVPRSSSSKS